MSVSIQAGLEAKGQMAENAIDGYPGFFLVRISAESVRSLGLTIVPDSETHANIVGNKTGAVRRALRNSAELLDHASAHTDHRRN